jgi:hypothetical protein
LQTDRKPHGWCLFNATALQMRIYLNQVQENNELPDMFEHLLLRNKDFEFCLYYFWGLLQFQLSETTGKEQLQSFGVRETKGVLHHATRHNMPIHNILSTAPQLSISQKALGTLPEDDNLMPKHVGAAIHN